MTDWKKVVQGLKHCSSRTKCNEQCPYNAIMSDPNYGIDDCTSQLAHDVLELLKEQKPKPVKFTENAYNYKTYYCPKCGRWFEFQFKKPKYCDQCGQAVNWNDIR